MASALESNWNREKGELYRLKFEEKPICEHCGNAMGIRHTSRPKTIIDLEKNIRIVVTYYQCKMEGCPGKKSKYLRIDNPYAPTNSDYSYKVYAQICYLRWKKHQTYEEIKESMEEDYNIRLSTNTIEFALKIYEIGCWNTYRPEYIKKMQENGGIILTIDGMSPMKGNKSLYVAYDYLTGLTIDSWRIPNQKADTIGIFLNRIKLKIEKDLGIKVLGIISDALPSQRIAIKNIFPEVKHCLCHYHFYKLVLIEPMNLDSSIKTEIRKKLRYIKEIKDYTTREEKIMEIIKRYPFLKDIFTILESLSNWKRHHKDPCFSGLELYSRLEEVSNVLSLITRDYSHYQIESAAEVLIATIYGKIQEILEDTKDKAIELHSIRDKLSVLKSILSDLDISFSQGLKKLREFRNTIRPYRLSSKCGKVEKKFIEALMKYVQTKGEMLFNFKKVPGAPTTNNDHELKYKQLKHFLRRVIGFASAKSYLLSHGERIVFVNIGESYSGILDILHRTDFIKAREIIDKERRPRKTMGHIIHYIDEWEKKIGLIKQMIEELKISSCIIN